MWPGENRLDLLLKKNVYGAVVPSLDPTVNPVSRRSRLTTLLSLSAILVVGLAGYIGYRASAQLDLGSTAGAGLVALAVVTGFAAFFSPCSFPLLLGMLTGSDTATAGGRSRREGVRSALAVGAGASAFLLLVGVVVGLVGEGVARSVGFSTGPGRALRGVVAVVVVGAGLMQLGVIRVSLWRIGRFASPFDRLRVGMNARHSRASQAVYGFGFVIAGFG